METGLYGGARGMNVRPTYLSFREDSDFMEVLIPKIETQTARASISKGVQGQRSAFSLHY